MYSGREGVESSTIGLRSSSRDCKVIIGGVSSSQAGHLRCLHEFVEAQARYYAQCHATMQDLQRELAG